MDTLKDFHSAPPWMNFLQYYHLTIISTINSWTKALSVLARYFAFDPKTSLSGWFHSGSVPENLGDFSS
jgi:hypothetical protein